jgi:hypothetical protein
VGGAALAAAGHSLVEGFLAGVTPFDPVTVVLVAALLVAAARADAVRPQESALRRMDGRPP